MGKQMATGPTNAPGFRAALLRRVFRPRGVHRCELPGQRLASCGVRRSIVARGTYHAYARAKDDDAGEKQESFAFGGSWHGAKMSRRDLRTTIEIVRAVPFSRMNPISSGGARDGCERFLIALPTAPPGAGEASLARQP